MRRNGHPRIYQYLVDQGFEQDIVGPTPEAQLQSARLQAINMRIKHLKRIQQTSKPGFQRLGEIQQGRPKYDTDGYWQLMDALELE